MFFSGGGGSSNNTDRSLLNPNLSFSHPAVTLTLFSYCAGVLFLFSKVSGAVSR